MWQLGVICFSADGRSRISISMPQSGNRGIGESAQERAASESESESTILENKIAPTVELRSSGPKSNINLTPTDFTFGPQTSFSLLLFIGYNRFLQKRMKVIGPFKTVRVKSYHTSSLGTNSKVFYNVYVMKVSCNMK